MYCYSLHLVNISEVMSFFNEEFRKISSQYHIPVSESEDIYDWVIQESLDRYLRRFHRSSVNGHMSYDLGKVLYTHLEYNLTEFIYPKLSQVFTKPHYPYKIKVMITNDTMIIATRA